MARSKKESDEVTVVLAHPLRAIYAARLGLEEKDYPVEAELTVRRDNARSLVNSGYAAEVDGKSAVEQVEAVEQATQQVQGELGATSGNK